MAHSIKRFVLTPSEAAQKALIVERIRMNPAGPWVNGKKVSLPKTKGAPTSTKKKD